MAERDVEAGARRAQQDLETRWQTQFGPGGVYAGMPEYRVDHIDYNGGWTAPNQYWDSTIRK